MGADVTLASPARIPRDAAGWVSLWRHAEIPVLDETAEQLEELRAREDDVDARLLAGVVSADPLMCLKLLAHVSTHRSSSRITDTETATAALVMMGIGPFFRQFGPQPTVQQRLGDQPEALDGLRRVLTRARRAACFALGFAVHRMDHDAEVIHEAALLHDFAEMLLWCHAPALALEIARLQAADPTLRSAVAQRGVLHAELVDVQQGLMRAWRLPELLVRISDRPPGSYRSGAQRPVGNPVVPAHEGRLGQCGDSRRRERHLRVAQSARGANAQAAARTRHLRAEVAGRPTAWCAPALRRRWVDEMPDPRARRQARDG